MRTCSIAPSPKFVGVDVPRSTLISVLQSAPPKHGSLLANVPSYLLSAPNFMTPEVFSDLVHTLANFSSAFASDPTACQKGWHNWAATSAFESNVAKAVM